MSRELNLLSMVARKFRLQLSLRGNGVSVDPPSFVGAARKKGCSLGSPAAVTLSSVASHRRIKPPTTRRRGEEAHSRLAIGLLPRAHSTTPWYAPSTNTNTPLSQQQPPPSPASTAGDRNNQHGFNRKHVALHPNLEARSARLEDVAIGKVADKTVGIQRYFKTLQAWMELAQHKPARGPHKSSPPVGIEAARRARSLLHALEHNLDPQKAKSTVLRPNATFYDGVLQTYAVCGGGKVAAMEAQAVLEHMLENARAALQGQTSRLNPEYPEPSVKSFNIVLNCWAKAKCEDSGIRAEGLLSLMDEWRRDCHEALQRDPSFPYRGCYPTATTLSTLIYALTESHGLPFHERAWDLLQEVLEAQRNPSMSGHRFCNVRLDAALFNSVIVSWMRSDLGREAASKAEEILSLAVKLHDEGLMKELPSKRTHVLVLDAWAICEKSTGECAQRAHDILFNMIRLYRQGVPIEFNVKAFTTCVMAWSRCVDLNDAPEKAEQILQELLLLHEETGVVDFQPDSGLWDAMQIVWLKATNRTESMDHCADIIQRMQKYGCQPSSQSYGRVLNAAGLRGLGDQALALLQQYGLYSNVPLLRDVRCLDGVLEALAREARDDAMDRATAFLEKMKCHDIYAKPDVQSYAVLLNSLSCSQGCRQAERGRDLLEDMMQRFQQGDESCRPNAYVISRFLKLCASTGGTDDDQRRALDIALEIFRKCESFFGFPPNHILYNIMLYTINHLTASENQRSERLELLEKVFEECQAAGCVSIVTLAAMRQGGASHCYSGLTKSSSRRVPHKDRPTRAGRLRRSDSG